MTLQRELSYARSLPTSKQVWTTDFNWSLNDWEDSVEPLNDTCIDTDISTDLDPSKQMFSPGRFDSSNLRNSADI